MARKKNRLVYKQGQYLPGELVAVSTEEITRGKLFQRLNLILFVIFSIGFCALLDRVQTRPDDGIGFGWSVPIWLCVVLTLAGTVGFFLLSRLAIRVNRLQGVTDRYEARFGKIDRE